MIIKYYANACFSVFHRGVHILCDPWLEAPAVAGGWTQFPPCRTKMRDIPCPDFVYVSHIHSDHCEPQTLAKLPKDVPILGLAREPAFLDKALRRQGFRNLRFTPERVRSEMGNGLTVEAFGATFNHLAARVTDSSMIFDFGDATVLNCNDNSPEEPFCLEVADRYPRIDVAFVPAGGGGAYPAMYENLSAQQQANISNEIVERYAQVFVGAVDILKPRFAVPVAGGYAVLGQSAHVNRCQPRRLNLMEIARRWVEQGKATTQVVPMQDGMLLDVDKGEIVQGQYREWTDEELDAYFVGLAKTKVEAAVTVRKKVASLGRLVEIARANMWKRQNELGLKPNYQVILDVDGDDALYGIDLSVPTVHRYVRSGALPRPYLRIIVDQGTMLEWLLGIEDYNMLDSGHRIRFFRDPNDYVQEAYVLMSFLRI